MKKIILSVFFIAVAIIVSQVEVLAQKETYDIISYKPLKGWTKETNDDAMMFTKIDGGSWCQIILYKNIVSKENINDDFDNEWKTLVSKNYQGISTPEKENPKTYKDWKVMSGSGVWKLNNKYVTTILNTYSGTGCCVSIVCNATAKTYFSIFQNFIADIELNNVKKEALSDTTQNQNASPALIGSWGKSNSVSQINNRFGTYSYNKQQYTFNANGTYTFLGKNYSEDYAETILIKESGFYTVNGDMVKVVPKTSVTESWSKKNGGDNWGQLKSSQKRQLENATYQVKMEDKNLILSISNETTRDGRFSNGNYYSYGPPETFTAIKLPGQ